jgi:hypothetical protein
MPAFGWLLTDDEVACVLSTSGTLGETRLRPSMPARSGRRARSCRNAATDTSRRECPPAAALRICACAAPSCLSCEPWRAQSRSPACGSLHFPLSRLCRFSRSPACSGASRAGPPRRSLSSISCASWPLSSPCDRGTRRPQQRSDGMHRHVNRLPPRAIRTRQFRIRHEAEGEEEPEVLFLGCVEKQAAAAAQS